MTRILPTLAAALAASLAFSGASPAQDATTTEAPAAAQQPGGETAAPAETGAPQPAATSDEFSAAVEKLSPLVQDVQVVGPWSEGDEHGVWRTVMVQPAGENAKTHFFIQQLDASGHDGLAIRSTTEIPEIAKMDGQVVGYRADDPNEAEPNSLSLFFEVVPSDGEISETYELHFMPGQPYVFGPASN
ncbi:hypothetical protein [Jiella avicenniae]|uniref:Copper(I)-binding protein n=1 Tax=Jiella avicenniae TaxID=2907202 RepID=A0A9X1T4Q4_9HYPH|nr:hypothetical protein [Jiella avicenniae]MCE7028029.1 hypothetical protein [Jiella avicenniae]